MDSSNGQFGIIENYDDCFKICRIIKNFYGEDGRILFHDVSKFYPGYCFNVVDKIYSSIKQGEFRYNSDNLIEIVNRYGIY